MDIETVVFSAAVAAGFGVLGSLVTAYLHDRLRGRDRLREALRPVCDQLGLFAEAHRNEAIAGLPCTGNRRRLADELRRLNDDPGLTWPRRDRRRAEELAAAYCQTRDDDAQGAATAADALRQHLGRLLR